MRAIAARLERLGDSLERRVVLERAQQLIVTVLRPVRAGSGVADNRIGASTRLAVVDAIVSGTHEPGTSHHALLAAFVSAKTLARVDAELEAGGYRTHEFGDSVLIERAAVRCGRDAAVARGWATLADAALAS